MADQLEVFNAPAPSPDIPEKSNAPASLFERLAEPEDDYQDNPLAHVEEVSEVEPPPPSEDEEARRPSPEPSPLQAMIIAPIVLAQLTSERLHLWRIQRIQKKAAELNDETAAFKDAAMALFKLPIGPELTKYQSALEAQDRNAITAGEARLADLLREAPETAKRITRLSEQGARIQVKAHRLIADSAYAARGVWLDVHRPDFLAGNEQIMRMAKFIAERIARLLSALKGCVRGSNVADSRHFLSRFVPGQTPRESADVDGH